MPTYRSEVGPEDKPVVKVVLHVDGQWGDLNDRQKGAWNKATLAISELCELYVEKAL
jgi:hypothetical protein